MILNNNHVGVLKRLKSSMNKYELKLLAALNEIKDPVNQIQLEDITGIRQSQLSQSQKRLEKLGLINTKWQGREIYLTVDEGKMKELIEWIDNCPC